MSQRQPLICCRNLNDLTGCQTLWELQFNQQFAIWGGLNQAEAALWAGVADEANTHTQVTARNVRYRTADIEKNMQTQNSGVSATFLAGEENVIFLWNHQVHSGDKLCWQFSRRVAS